MAWPGVDQLIPSISTLVLTRQGFFFPDIIISSTFGSCALSLWLYRSPLPQAQPIRYHSLSWHLFSIKILSPFPSVCVKLLFARSTSVFHLESSTKTAAIICSRLRVYLSSPSPFCLTLSRIGPPMFHQRHIACFRISHWHSSTFGLRTN
ncbi:hypothetical protein B0F90DRAFT_319900 [Multifurca ochricompacta]|uniref:Uncharacterized protein n=1 Tax=Multifurca ochricompacta TaxID=376703 RepID=A0AAD4M6L2_9AGAM|nr:hypothetical protein B0F90DRAFT_319900 [Multifurca ochricompacta]